MQRSYLLLIFLMSPFSLWSQLNESFSDNNFTNNPVWMGDTPYFTINTALQLQSNGPNSTAQLHLSTPNTKVLDTEWDFYVNLDFDITTTNWAKIYLISDRIDTENNPKGYYVKFDGTNNSVDFYKQDSATHTKLLAGKVGRAAKLASNTFLIKVIYDTKGNWHLFSDSTALGTNFFKEGTVFDTTFNKSNYAGVYFAHSSTRRTKFYFDNFSVKLAPLSLLSAKASAANSLDIIFSREVELLSATNISNYSLPNSNLAVINASIDPINKKIVHLLLDNELNTYTNYTIQTQNIVDLNLTPITFLNSSSFNYRIETTFGDLIITELFPDPSPQNGLPEVEYIELYNRKNDTLNLKDFTFSDGTSKGVFPYYKIPPHSYILICQTNNIPQFSAWKPLIGLSIFPSLNNSGDHITLNNQNGVLLHEVSYTDLWYRDNDKKLGGWSLEIIDSDNPCGEEQNWTSSIDPSGGTPTQVNSVAAYRPDISAPVLISAFIIDSLHIQLTFDEKPVTTYLTSQQFILSNREVLNIYSQSTTPEILILAVSKKFNEGEIYKLIFSGIKDCNGNVINQTEVFLVLPQKADKGDIILNEVLFNPKSGGYDFVEIYNNSKKYINLKKWQLATIQDGKVTSKELIASTPFIIKPNEYVAFTENKNILLNFYPLGDQKSISTINNLPSYNDNEGTVLVLDSTTNEYDRFDYSEDMHYKLIDDKEGISLERIAFTIETNTSENWQSASSQAGYATPGYRNSQHLDNTEGSEVWVAPQVFTPDNNGDKDFAQINYKFNDNGNTANITIYDHYGREIIKLAQNELLSTEGFYKWEGNNTKNEKVRGGLYIVYFELFNLEGKLKKYKESIVVGWSK